MMKKLIIALLVAGTLLTGCQSSSGRQLDQEKYDAYLTYYQEIISATDKLSGCDYFDIELVVNALSDGSYRYDVVIDNPKVAMYGIEVLAVVLNAEATINYSVMMPSIGIMDDDAYNMIPNQVNKAKGFVEGLDVSGTLTALPANVGVMVSFKDSTGQKVTRLYFGLSRTEVSA